MKLKKQHLHVLTALHKCDHNIGATWAGVLKAIGVRRKYTIAMARLCWADYVEARREGDPWYGEQTPPDVKPSNGKSLPLRYRITARGVAALEEAS